MVVPGLLLATDWDPDVLPLCPVLLLFGNGQTWLSYLGYTNGLEIFHLIGYNATSKEKENNTQNE